MNIRILFLAFIFSLFSATLASQVLFSEDFESVNLYNKTGDIPEGWTLYNDSNRPSNQFSYCDQAWKVREMSDGNKKAVSTSWFTNPNSRADRWMITPVVDLSNVTHPYLIFNAQSGDATDLESYFVSLSTSGVEKEDFTETLLTVSNESYSVKTRAISLGAFKNEKVYIAFMLNSLNKYALYLDDIQVIDLGIPIVTLSDLNAPVITTVDSEINLSANGFFMTHTPISSYQINYTLNDGEPISHLITDVAIENMQSHSIRVPAFSFSEGGVYDLKLWISHLNNLKNASSNILEHRIEVTEKTYYPRKTLLEVFSSSTCGPCASANIHMKKAYTALNANTEETNLYVIKYQVNIPNHGDPAVTDEGLYHSSYYGVNSAPMGFLNGSKYTGKWADAENELPQHVENQLNNKTPFWLESGMHRDDNHFQIDVTIKNTGAYENARLIVAFLEDSIYHEPQSNGETMFFNVFRKNLPSPYGEELTFTESGEQTLSFEYTFDMVNPKIFHTLDSVSAIAFLQDNSTKEILQVTYMPAISFANSIDDIKDTDGVKVDIAPNPCTGNTKLYLTMEYAGKVSIDIYNTKGSLVKKMPATDYQQGNHVIDINMEDLSSGIYFIKVNNGESSFTKKILLSK